MSPSEEKHYVRSGIFLAKGCWVASRDDRTFLFSISLCLANFPLIATRLAAYGTSRNFAVLSWYAEGGRGGGQVLPVQSMSGHSFLAALQSSHPSLFPTRQNLTLDLSLRRSDAVSQMRREFLPVRVFSTLRGIHNLADRDANCSIIAVVPRREDQIEARRTRSRPGNSGWPCKIEAVCLIEATSQIRLG